MTLVATPDRRYESDVDVNGIKTITSFRTNELGQQVKVTQKVKVSKKTVKVAKSVIERRKWAKFGYAAGNPAGYHGRGWTDAGTTSIDVNEQMLDMTPKEVAMEENNESAQRAFEKMNVGAFEAWRPKQRDTSLTAAKEWAEANGLATEDDNERPMSSRIGGSAGTGSLAALAAGQQSSSSYVPPSMRNADGSRNAELANQRDDSCTVRVSNLSEDVKDADLRELFRRFGPIQRIYLAKDRETHQSRGFAFINFFDQQARRPRLRPPHPLRPMGQPVRAAASIAGLQCARQRRAGSRRVRAGRTAAVWGRSAGRGPRLGGQSGCCQALRQPRLRCAIGSLSGGHTRERGGALPLGCRCAGAAPAVGVHLGSG